MPRVLIVLVPILLLVLTAAACDGGGSDASPTPATPATTTSPGATPPLTPNSTPTDATPDSTSGTPSAVLPHRVTDLLIDLSQLEFMRTECDLDVEAAQIDCAENGVFPIDPPPAEDAKCELFVADGEPVAVACETQDPSDVTYYEIQ